MKIKTLRDILEPKATELGISFKGVLETISDDKKFEYVMSHFDKIKNNKNKGFFRVSIESFKSFKDFTIFCKSNFNLDITVEMYNVYNKNICTEVIQNQIKKWKRLKEMRGYDGDVLYHFKEWGTGLSAKEQIEWTEEIQKYKSIEEIKQHAQEKINHGADEAITGLWQQNIISYFIEFHARSLIWNKTKELKLGLFAK